MLKKFYFPHSVIDKAISYVVREMAYLFGARAVGGSALLEMTEVNNPPYADATPKAMC